MVFDSEIFINNIDFYNGKLCEEVKTLEKTKCPECDAELEVPKDVMQGEILTCPSCGLELEVRRVKGGSVELQELGIEGEDWGE